MIGAINAMSGHKMKIKNDYRSYREVENHDLLVVEMADSGWSIADGMGTKLTPEDEIELAGWHLPVRFKTAEQAYNAVKNGPQAWFDITIDAEWTKHAIDFGATYEPLYEM
jgi:hypothetical protein